MHWRRKVRRVVAACSRERKRGGREAAKFFHQPAQCLHGVAADVAADFWRGMRQDVTNGGEAEVNVSAR